MSRIDQALKIWEGGTEASPPDSVNSHPHGSTVLDQYLQEGLDAPAPDVGHSSRLPESPSSDSTPTTLRTDRRVAKPSDDADSRSRLITAASSTTSTEQYRRLAAVLHEEQVQSQLKTVMITSAVPQEGKTLTTVNLALTLSESYARRVLVIDADLRWPSLHTVLNISNDQGLSEALRDSRLELPLTVVSSRLTALTAGHPGPTPLAALSSPRMGEVIEECVTLFDWVLIDTSPVGVLPDAQVLTRLVGGVIFVIGAGVTPAAEVERAITELGRDSIIGTVLNRVEERRIQEAGYYGKYGTSSGGSH